MCNGTIMDKLISFSIPLMLSGILQLMFNAVDIVVVGRFSGSQALAAVGSTTALINVFTNLFIGISLGANVLAARYYAAGKTKEMSETVHTAIALALVSGVAMAVIGVVFARGALEIMGTPDDVIAKSTLYMRIYFCGMPFFMMYNYGAAILRAVGDTKRPLIFLIVSGVINAILNLFLVIGFHLDVAGVGIATVISQLVSCILVLLVLDALETLPPIVHASNSATSLWHADTIFTAVRLGDVMYGLNPSGSVLALPYEIKPALSLVSELVHVKQLEAGQDIGYGATYTTEDVQWIGTIPIGYADGWIREMQNFHVLIKGEFCPIVGRVSMDQVTVRLPEELPLGTKVTLIGRDGEKEITATEIADYRGTINYEVVCLLSDRIPRDYAGKE